MDETAEVQGVEVEESEVEEGGIEEIEIDMGEMDDSNVEGSDDFEDCEWKEKIPPIFQILVTTLSYEHPPTTAFDPLYTPQSPVTRGLV